MTDTITVNGVAIPDAAVLAEMQYHPASSADAALQEAKNALVVRELLLQRAAAIGLDRAHDEALDQLLAAEIRLPEPDEESCRRYYEANRARFRSPTLYEARHILLAAPPDDSNARDDARAKAEQIIACITKRPETFTELAGVHSACLSKDSGGHLGQFTSGTTVAEFETFLENLEPGQLSPVPVPSRYGYHVLQLLARAPGRDLPYTAVRERIADYLSESVFRSAVRQYVSLLAAEAQIAGVAIDAATSPLVQ
jgi:peptidyl-prolyl cis-trans isomerase C